MAEGTTKYTWEDFLKELEGSGLKGQFSEADMRLAQQNPDAGMSILSYKRDYANATNDQARALANAGAERVRSSFGGYTAGTDGSQYYRDSLSPRDFSYADAPTYQSRYDGKAQELLDALMNRESFSYEEAPTYQSRYDAQIQERLQGLLDRPDFSYDVEKDPLYSQYRKQYVREGQRASADAMGQAAAMSGGLPSSYAGTAAGQAANYYNAQLTDKIPELEEWIDNFTADSLVRARYRQNVQNRQMSEAAAMEEADNWVAGVMADRSKGSTPTLFNRSNPLTKLFTQFQLEVNNQLSYVCKDMPRGFKEKGLGALALALFKFALGAWLYDEVYEYFIGRRAALDPIGMLNDTVGDLTGYELPNLVSLGVGAVTGDVPSFKTGKAGIGQAGINLAENVAEEMPFVGGLLGGGRLPISSAIPDIGNLWGAATNSSQAGRKRWNTAVKEIGKPLTYLLLPFGGGQMKKILEGVSAVVKGGSYTVDSKGRDIMQYPIYNDSGWETAWNVGKASLFGKSSFPGAQRWVDSEFKNYSAKATGAYQGLTQAGVRGRDADDLVIALTGAEETEGKSKKEVQIELLRSSKIPEDMKIIPYYALMASEKEIELIDELAENGAAGELLDMLMSYDQAGKLKDGKSDAQRKAVFDSKLTDREKITAIGILEPSTSYTAFKMQTAQDYGISMDDYYAAVYGAKDTDGDGKVTQKEKIAAIRALNLSNEKKAVLYQLADSGWTPKNNPFATGVGQEVYDLIQKEKERRENSGEEEEEKGKARWEGGRMVLPKW